MKEDIYIRQRYVVGLLGFFALINAYIQRFSMSLAITEMANPIHHANSNAFGGSDCPAPEVSVLNTSISYEITTEKFDWSENTQGLILSSVFWGYVLTQIPGGMLAERYGGKHTLGFGMLVSTICTILIPKVASEAGATGIIVLRFLIGLGQGPIYPSLNVVLSHWAPLTERGRLGALIFAGAQIGVVISMGLSGILVNSFGWQSVFYCYGVLGIVWYCCWLVLIYDEPSDHPFITKRELSYLQESVKGVTDHRQRSSIPPWKKIFTSSAVLGLIVAQIGHDWGLFTIISDMPKYMKSVLHFSVTENGYLSALPYIVMWVAAQLSGIITDYLIKHRHWNITTVRKLFVTIASIFPGLGMLAASYSQCNRLAVSISFTAGVGFMGSFVPSLKVNPLDLSPNYAGTLMAIVGGIGAVTGIFAPCLVAFLTTDGTLLEWRSVFWITFLILAFTNVVYLIYGSAEIQPWNYTTATTTTESTYSSSPKNQQKQHHNHNEDSKMATRQMVVNADLKMEV